VLQNDNILDRLERLEASVRADLQEIQFIKQEFANTSEATKALEIQLNAKQVAELLQRDVKYVYAMARKKKIPAFKNGKYWTFCPSKVQKWFERQHDS
jgi:excisionase family DNA binding protein